MPSGTSRLLKKNFLSTAACVTKKYARSGRAAEPDIQLLIAGGAGAEGSSVARDPGYGGRGTGLGRPSIAPEKLLRAQLLPMLYSIRSERLLMEEMDYKLLFRWLWFQSAKVDFSAWIFALFGNPRREIEDARQILNVRDRIGPRRGHWL